MPKETTGTVDLDDPGTGLRFVRLAPGLYADPEEEGILILHLGDLVRRSRLDDTQETRAAIYGAWSAICDRHGLELLLVREPDAPSVRDTD